MHILNAALLFLRDFFPVTLIKLSTGLLGKFLANGVGEGRGIGTLSVISVCPGHFISSRLCFPVPRRPV